MNTATSSQMLLAFWRQRDLEAPWGRRLLIALAVVGVGLSLYFAPQWWQAVLGGSAVLVLSSLWMTVVGACWSRTIRMSRASCPVICASCARPRWEPGSS